MSSNFAKLALESTPLATNGTELGRPDIRSYKTDIAGLEEIMVSETVDPGNLKRLLGCLVNEDCVHSWRNFGSDGTLDALLEWENRLRPTKLFFFYIQHQGELIMIGASAVAEKLTRDFPYPGFCVLGRCYIMPQFRSYGFYRYILSYRLDYCKERFGDELKAIHIGSVNDRISRVISSHNLDGWSRFIHLGEEELHVAGQVKTVGAYMLLLPQYIHSLQRALAGKYAPQCVYRLRYALSLIEEGDVKDLGPVIKDAFEEAIAHGWFTDHDAYEIEQLLLFCRSIPLVGF
ncbi:MAG TPA: hypothetical protein VHA33_23175 [Candidatus Angelobacter sp.]|jgi:hypothetical protein|nr:hypothetical protein [Candidatus Angelobacter sp.]